MCCNYVPLLRLLWLYMQALVSATSAGSRRPLSFQDQWACPRQVLGGHRSMSKTPWAFCLTPTDPPAPLAAPPLLPNCDRHTPEVSGLTCMRERAHNIRQTWTQHKRGRTLCTLSRHRAFEKLGLKRPRHLIFNEKPVWTCWPDGPLPFLCFRCWSIHHIQNLMDVNSLSMLRVMQCVSNLTCVSGPLMHFMHSRILCVFLR